MGVVEDKLVTRHRARPLILVMPFGSTGTFTDKEWVNGVRPGNGWATIRRARSRPGDRRPLPHGRRRARRAIAGLSEGGYGAINIALHHPARVLGRRELVRATSARTSIRAIFGHEPPAPRGERSATAAPSRRGAVAEARHTYFWFYSGSNDPLHKQNAAFARELAARPRAAPVLPGLRRPQLGALARTGPRRVPRSRLEAPRMRSAGRSVAAAVLALGVLVAATGWLYVARPVVALPGPLVHERSRSTSSRSTGACRSSSICSCGAQPRRLLGAIARWARLERLAAGLLLGLGVGGWLYAVNGVSILVVRQIPAHQAFHAAAAEQAVVIPARARGHRRRAARTDAQRRRLRAARLVLAWLVGRRRRARGRWMRSSRSTGARS